MKLSTTWITSISLLIGASAVGIAAFSQVNFKAAATASNIPPALTKLSDKSYLLTWTDNSAVYVSCYPTVKPRMKPAPIKQTPNRYVITCKNK
ncbi:hypothetical protein [Nostoc sp.]|uniref:hypothetical protein n=1 Tax=Nostoc sp. TaxID=1180 RepID=UPI002FFBD9DD